MGELKKKNKMWKTIENYETYEVSDTGKVRNIRTGKILGRRVDKDGYPQVCLYSNGKGLDKKVHRLVANAFLDADPERDQVNHKNGNKEDNRVENLEWCNRSENTRHAYANGLLHANMRPAIAARTKLSENDKLNIICMRDNGIPVKDIAHKYDVSLNTIYEICKRR